MVQEQHIGVSFQEGEEMLCSRYDQDTAYMYEIVNTLFNKYIFIKY